MLKNAALTAENNLLKQQIDFLQKVIVKEELPSQSIFDNNKNLKKDNSILPFQNKEQIGEDYYIRIPQINKNSKKHVTFLGILTIVIYIIGFIGNSKEEVLINN